MNVRVVERRGRRTRREEEPLLYTCHPPTRVSNQADVEGQGIQDIAPFCVELRGFASSRLFAPSTPPLSLSYYLTVFYLFTLISLPSIASSPVVHHPPTIRTHPPTIRKFTSHLHIYSCPLLDYLPLPSSASLFRFLPRLLYFGYLFARTHA